MICILSYICPCETKSRAKAFISFVKSFFVKAGFSITCTGYKKWIQSNPSHFTVTLRLEAIALTALRSEAIKGNSQTRPVWDRKRCPNKAMKTTTPIGRYAGIGDLKASAAVLCGAGVWGGEGRCIAQNARLSVQCVAFFRPTSSFVSVRTEALLEQHLAVRRVDHSDHSTKTGCGASVPLESRSEHTCQKHNNIDLETNTWARSARAVSDEPTRVSGDGANARESAG